MDAGGSGVPGRVRADINVTPLVDIVLVLLIIFIVITPAVNDAVRLPIAKHSLKPEEGARPLSLVYLARRNPGTGAFLGPGQVLVEDKEGRGALQSFALGTPAERSRLAGFVSRAVQAQGDKRVQVKADAAMPFRYVHELLLVCREAGALEASIVTSEDKRED